MGLVRTVVKDGVQLQPTGDGSLTLYSTRYQQSYASHKGAYQEAMHVFVEGSGIAARLRAGQACRVLEVGLGTGLNFLLTAQCALTQGSGLEYHALEHQLLPAEVWAGLKYHRYIDSALWSAWLEWRATLPNPLEHSCYTFRYDSIKLEVHHGDAREYHAEQPMQAVYMDAFSPEVNPELWQPAFLASLYEALVRRGTLTSYCVQGKVRRQLTQLGFTVAKRKGPEGGKREVLLAHKS